MPNFGSTGYVDLLYYDYEDEAMRSDGEVSLDLVARNPGKGDMAVLLQGFVSTLGYNSYRQGAALGRLLREANATTQGQIINMLLGILSGMSEQDLDNASQHNRKALLTARKVDRMIDDKELDLQPFV